jgi:hypothetical protein
MYLAQTVLRKSMVTHNLPSSEHPQVVLKMVGTACGDTTSGQQCLFFLSKRTVCRLDLEIREELGRVLFRRERSSTHGGIALLPLLSIEVRIIREFDCLPAHGPK